MGRYLTREIHMENLMFLENPLVQIALKIGIAVLVFLVGRWLAGRVRAALDRYLGKTKIAPSMVRLLILAAYYGIMLLVLIFALAIVGVPLQPMLTASLLIVVVIGFALQQSLSNLAATILFMLFEPFRVGELVEANGWWVRSRNFSCSTRCWSPARTRKSPFPIPRSRAII